MQLTQSQIALIVGFCLSLGVQPPKAVPCWNGIDVRSFDHGKELGRATAPAKGAHHE